MSDEQEETLEEYRAREAEHENWIARRDRDAEALAALIKWLSDPETPYVERKYRDVSMVDTASGIHILLCTKTGEVEVYSDDYPTIAEAILAALEQAK